MLRNVTKQLANKAIPARGLSTLSRSSNCARRMSQRRQTPIAFGNGMMQSSHINTQIPTLARRQFSTEMERESMEYDVLVVGGGPAGLSAAIRLKQLANEQGRELNVCLIDKGSEIGAHILSGNVFQPTYLNELIPDWKEKDHPLTTPVTHDEFYLLTKNDALPLPIPPSLDNHGNYIISLGALCKFLAQEAEALGVEIYAGFAAAEVLYDENGAVRGVATGDMGIGKDGQPTENYARGMELIAKHTLFAEGARGSCSEEVITKYNLREGKEQQTYGIGIKEVWEIDPAKHQPGHVMHTVGYPTPNDTYCGTFLYHMTGNFVHVGMVIGLDYPNPYLNPYMEFQTYKHHPKVKAVLEGGKCVSYGARVINEGGYQSIPKLAFPGGALIGCSAGFVNVPKIKGSHNAMKTGMEAAEAIMTRLGSVSAAAEQAGETLDDAALVEKALSGYELTEYITRMETSPVTKELYEVRNIRPAFKYGFLPFMINAGLEQMIFRRSMPWTISHHDGRDCDATLPKDQAKPIEYMKPDGVISFNLLDNLIRSGVRHEEDQPSHLKIKPGLENMPKESFEKYAAPESRFCPAGVYEYLPQEDGSHKLQINAQNCVHCKTCSIKTPNEFIKWTVPQGGEGPAYQNM